MRALFICSSIPSRGIHHYAALLPQAMMQQGVEVRIVSSPGEADPGVRSRLAGKGIEVIDFPSPESRGRASAEESSEFLSDVLSQEEFDVIHVFGYAHARRCWLAQQNRAASAPVPIIVTLSALRHGQIEEWPARIVASHVLNRMPGVVSPLSSIEERKMRRAGMRAEKLRMVPFFIDSHEMEQRAAAGEGAEAEAALSFVAGLGGAVLIVYLADFIPRKGHRELLYAAREVAGEHPEAVFILAGAGPDLAKTKQLARRLGLQNKVMFPGRLPIAAVPALLRRANIGVVSSRSETFGSAIVEPLLMGRPVVTTPVGFASDLDEKGGVAMVPRRRPRQMAAAISRLINDPDLSREIAERGRDLVIEKCDINQVAKQYLSVYEEVAA